MPSTPCAPAQLPALLGARIAQFATRTPQQPALIFADRTWTYAGLHRAIGVVAAGLAQAGVSRGDFVVMAGSPRPEAVFTLFAGARLGVVLVPVHDRTTASELHTVVAAVRPAATVGGADFLTRTHPDCRLLSWDEGVPGADTLSERADLSPLQEWLSAPDDAAILGLTSGTTGQPKGALLSHRNIFWGTRNALQALNIGSADRVLVTTPLAHVAVFGGLPQTVWTSGGTVILTPGFHAALFHDHVAHYRPTIAFVVPTMLDRLIRSEGWQQIGRTTLKRLVVGGAPTIGDPAQRSAVTSPAIINSYGLTEASGGVTFTRPADVGEHPLSVGHPAAHVEIRIADDTGAAAAPNIPGEILLRGPSITDAYLMSGGSRSAAVDDAGWLHTGDRGVLDRDGRLFVSGRIKDTIVTGGEKVYPSEVEDALSSLIDVGEVAIIGVPDDEWGELVTAVIVPRPEVTLTLHAVRRHLESRLSRHKIPRRLILADALPRTPTGKLQRRLLTETVTAVLSDPSQRADEQQDSGIKIIR